MNGGQPDDFAIDVAGQLHVPDPQFVARRGQKTVLRGDLQGEPVAVKVVDLRRMANSAEATTALKRAEREVAFLREVEHPNVVRAVTEMLLVRSDIEEPAAAAWCEEWIEGQDLSESLGDPWSWQRTRRMAIDVAAGLTAFHEHPSRIVHRDLSPGNVRALADGTYKVMDPGLARFIEATGITGPFQPGTIGYASPEHVSPVASPIPASDVFCLGILMYQALSGALPVEPGDSYVERLRAARVTPITDLRQDLDDDAAAIVQTCLQALAPRRYPTARELLSALESFDG